MKAAPETGHVLAGVFESSLPPGGGFPIAHLHEEYEEVFYVLDGEIEYRLGDALDGCNSRKQARPASG